MCAFDYFLDDEFTLASVYFLMMINSPWPLIICLDDQFTLASRETSMPGSEGHGGGEAVASGAVSLNIKIH